jgi:virulence factor
MMAKHKMRVAIVGLGDIARKAYLPILTAHKAVDLILYNRSPESLQEMQALYRIEKGTDSMSHLIEQKPEAAFVLTSSPSHFQIVKQLLKNGIDVFVEKPATLHSWETEELAELADREDRILMVGFNRRFAPLHVKAKKKWGNKPVSMGIFHKYRTHASHPNIQSQLIDDTIHQIDILRFYCGEGHAVSITQETTPDKFMGAVCIVELDKGGIGVIETTMKAGRWQEDYSLMGSEQTMEIDVFSEVSLVRDADQQRWTETYASAWKPTLEGRGFVAEIEHFFSCVEERRMPMTSAWDSVKTQLLIEEMIDLAQGESEE